MARPWTHRPVVTIVPFEQITPRQLLAVLCLRNDVFVVEQQITAEAEVDAQDGDALHVLAFDGEEAARLTNLSGLMGTARLVPTEAEHQWKVGRVAVAQRWRRNGVGGLILESIGRWLDDAHPARTGVMHAQAHLEAWYAGHGWQREGEGFIEAEIPHVRMVRPVRS